MNNIRIENIRHLSLGVEITVELKKKNMLTL